MGKSALPANIELRVLIMNDDDTVLKMAQLQTILDAIKLLEYLRIESSSQHYKQIDFMILRLTNMGKSLS